VTDMARPNGYRMVGGHNYMGEIPQRVLERIKERTAFGAVQVPRSKRACNLWLGGLSGGGRPRISWFDGERKVDVTATVTSILYRIERLDGGIIPPTHLLCHTCDVFTCVNEEHVYLGTPTFNGSDLRHRGSAASQGIREIEIVRQLQLRGLPHVTESGRQYFEPTKALPKWLEQQARAHNLLQRMAA
jgi:hypothetical protein